MGSFGKLLLSYWWLLLGLPSLHLQLASIAWHLFVSSKSSMVQSRKADNDLYFAFNLSCTSCLDCQESWVSDFRSSWSISFVGWDSRGGVPIYLHHTSRYDHCVCTLPFVNSR